MSFLSAMSWKCKYVTFRPFTYFSCHLFINLHFATHMIINYAAAATVEPNDRNLPKIRIENLDYVIKTIWRTLNIKHLQSPETEMIRNSLILVVTASELIFWQILAVWSRCTSCHQLCSVQINSSAKIYNLKKGLPMWCRLHTECW